MKVHIIKPYSIEKNLGRAYNEAMSMIPDGDWACLMDYDTMFLTPDCGQILHEWATHSDKFAGLGLGKTLYTCYTNRIHPLAKDQLLNGELSENTDIQYHIEIAEKQRAIKTATFIDHEISGFLMMIPKSLWHDLKFWEQDGKCLGIDNNYSLRVLRAGYHIARIDGLYVWHTYRLKNGIKDKTHLT